MRRLMRQEKPAVYIADGVDIRYIGAHQAVGANEALGVGLDSGVGEIQFFGVGGHAD